jgi:membrane-bound inhibitor of C-type lysozyme
MTATLTRLGGPLCVLVLLAGCAAPARAPSVAAPARDAVAPAPDTASPPPPRTLVYQCADGLRFVARTEGETASVFLPDRTIHLRHVPAASGAKYSDGQVTLWGKGEEAVLELGDESRRACRNDRRQAVWEDAKLRGVDFRATGNEPGWYLELVEGGRSVLVTHYGEGRYEFIAPPPLIDQTAGVTTYRVSTPALLLVIRRQVCRDTMSDDSYETAVTVTVDGRKYRGCGRALH